MKHHGQEAKSSESSEENNEAQKDRCQPQEGRREENVNDEAREAQSEKSPRDVTHSGRLPRTGTAPPFRSGSAG
jgi:hypothetical protein